MVCLVQIMHQYKHYLQMDWNEIPHDPYHQGLLSGVSKTIFELMVHSAQTVHLSCTDTNTIYKWTEMKFHMTHITYVFYRVCSK
jgi:hypothetical protein